MHPIDTDAVRWRPGTGDDLLVLLHGVGSDEADLFGLAGYLPEKFTVASLRAPLRYGFGGWAWFEFDPMVDSDDHTMIDESAAGVLAWLDGLDRKYARVHLFGFSQGGATAVQLARLEPERFASIAHLSSFVHKGELPRDAELAAKRLPLLQTFGHLDDVIAPDKRDRSMPWLDEHFDVERHWYQRGHGVVAEEIEDVVAFLNRV